MAFEGPQGNMSESVRPQVLAAGRSAHCALWPTSSTRATPGHDRGAKLAVAHRFEQTRHCPHTCGGRLAGGFSGVLRHLQSVAGEVLGLPSVYRVMPAGRLALRHALIGGVTVALLWEITRHVLIWYFGTLSQVNVVYGSLTTAIVVFLKPGDSRRSAAVRGAGDCR